MSTEPNTYELEPIEREPVKPLVPVLKPPPALEPERRERNFLSTKKVLRLCDYVRDTAKASRTLTHAELAANAEKALGFPVTEANVKNAREATEVEWFDPRQAAEIDVKRAIPAIAAGLVRVMYACGIESDEYEYLRELAARAEVKA